MDFSNDEAVDALNKLVSEGKLSAALPMLTRIDVAACGDEATARNIIKVATHSGDVDTLVSVAAKLSQNIKSKFLVALDLAQDFVKRGDIERGVHYFLWAQEIAPTNYWSYYWYALFKAERHKYNEAVAIISTALERCKGKVSVTEWENLQREYLRFLCLARRDDVKYAKPLLNRNFFTGRPVPNALFVTMVKDEDDIIYESLSAAYRCGFRYFLVANNGSSDRTEAEVRRFAGAFPDSTVVIIWDPITGYWQDKKMNAFWRFGVEYLRILGTTIDWVFPVDADEALVQADAHVDLFHVLNSPASEHKTLAVGMWCTASASEVFEERDPGLDLNAAFPVVSGFDFAPSTKVAIRCSPTASVGMGAHFASGCIEQPGDVLCLNEYGIFMLHHPSRSKRQYRSKITNGMKALQAATTLGVQHGSHWRKAYETYASRGEVYIDEQLDAHITRNKKQSALLAQRATDAG
jgi:tetratricopeptide (TPR) repeat protein